jgi:hypothetical protein
MDESSEKRDGDVVFHASEIAAVLGRNRYEKRWQAICKVWRRHSRDSFARSGIVLPDDLIDDIASSNADVRCAIEEASRVPPSDVGEIVERSFEVAKKLGMSSSDSRAFADRLRKESYCSHGNSEEPKTVEELRSGSRPGIAVDQKFVKKILSTMDDGTRILVGGRLDATDSSRVVEIKNRVGGLRFEIPEYELPQVYAYMFAKNADSATLVERTVLSDGTGFACQHDVSWNSEEWDSVRRGLEDVAKAVRILATDDETALAFSSSRTKDAFLNKLCK